FPDLQDKVDEILNKMARNQVGRALVVSVTVEDWPRLIALVEQYDHLHASVGVHPGYDSGVQPTVADLLERAQHPSVIRIGETGLDCRYPSQRLGWQRDRCRVRIQAARETGPPLIAHTPSAADDTTRITKEEQGQVAGGVMHCFTGSGAMAEAA